MSTPQPTPEPTPSGHTPAAQGLPAGPQDAAADATTLDGDLVVTLTKPTADAAPTVTRRGGSHAALRYTLCRIGLFAAVSVVVWLVCYAVGITGRGAGILVVGISLAISGVLSYFLLNGQRDAMSAALVERVERAKARIDEGASAEDHLIGDLPDLAPRRGPTTDVS
ncbi:DUF4229 domain-containing protein [Yinghuangia sp. ASG 101]|uniref:DUF4229 domain-containing protein n=1 Tax=Yinghuangia sp. ASG 101 TaxID=2896848 RepID=UPI001E2B9ADA|nr:DUF4229 domain-containing protein [Yinghuangia sp. ASG 101]UGQ14726.1 DUF4229 domain-containing protein [Yinghuangia sp. ASG 101]